MEHDGPNSGKSNAMPWIIAEIDQAQAAVRENRLDGPQAAAEVRCAVPPMGCGQPLGAPLSTAFRDRASRAEYDITHLCQSCQDLTFARPPEDVLAMAKDPHNFERCSVCGNWVELEHVDVGVGVMSGHDCCADVRHYGGNRKALCTRTEGCYFEEGHFYDCETRATSEEDRLDVDAAWKRLRTWMLDNGLIGQDEGPGDGQA